MTDLFFDLETQRSFQEVGGRENIKLLRLSVAVTFSTSSNEFKSYTESDVARRVLDRWDEYVGRFVKVLPSEYRKVLERQHLNVGSDMARLAAV